MATRHSDPKCLFASYLHDHSKLRFTMQVGNFASNIALPQGSLTLLQTLYDSIKPFKGLLRPYIIEPF